MNKAMLLNLRRLLAFAEKDFGLDTLSEMEKQVYYAAIENADAEGNFLSETIRKSDWCSDIPRATYHRLLGKLIELGIFEKVENAQRNHYKISGS